MLLLAIDTSTPTSTAGVLSVSPSVAGGGSRLALVSEHTFTGPFAHAEQIMPLVDAALGDAGHRLRDLDGIVVGLGPGPFTGLRVGIATAQALGDALEISVYGVSSHDGAAGGGVSEANPETGRREQFLVVTDARRREVYLSAYGADGGRCAGPVVISPAAVPNFLRDQQLRPTVVLGAGVALLSPVLPELQLGEPSEPMSSGLARAALAGIRAGIVPGALIPLYLRRPDATEPGPRKSVLG